MQRKWPASLNYTLPHIEAGNAMPPALRDRIWRRASRLMVCGVCASLAAPLAVWTAADVSGSPLPEWAATAMVAAGLVGWWLSVRFGHRLAAYWRDRATAKFLEQGRWE